MVGKHGRDRAMLLLFCVAAGALACGCAFTVPGASRPLNQPQRAGASTSNVPSQSSVLCSTSAATVAGSAVALALYAAAQMAQRRTKAASTTGRKVTVARQAEEFDDVCKETGVTLNRYMLEMTKRGVIDSDMESIFNSIREGGKTIRKLVNRAPLMQAELLGLEGNVNVQGEDQKKLDVITNDVLKAALKYTGKLGTIASEEEDAPVAGTNEGPDAMTDPLVTDTGKYAVVFDPLDGSSNVDAGIPVGTIFGVFKEPEEDYCDVSNEDGNLTEEEIACLAQTLQPGTALVAAGYILYSSSTELVFTIGQGTVGFTLDQAIGEFVMTRPKMEIPKRGQIYSMNEANIMQWDEPMRQWIQDIQSGKGETGKKYSQRYIGSMVGDVHRTLLYGGVFAYPCDTKNKDGKLRLLYEAAPMSFLVEQAGGKSITGHSRVMDIPPVAVHQRVPIILGSPEDIDECKKYYDKSDDESLKAKCKARLEGRTFVPA
mmetsp:Transcript_55148/g.129114  ORF Transcript_55148/g.129114 Transcript_55148/m.129114 type:complete len:487 (-) Transcript_55148:96-1556(-)